LKEISQIINYFFGSLLSITIIYFLPKLENQKTLNLNKQANCGQIKKAPKVKTLETLVFVGGEYRSRTGDLLPARLKLSSMFYPK